jgi:hypothetical protein
MAQLRDARTSDILYEGTPLEVALMAEKLGRDEVLFDDVGGGFDHQATIAAHQDNVEGHARVTRSRAKDITDDDKQRAKEALDTLKGHEERVEEHHKRVQRRLAEVRARLEE